MLLILLYCLLLWLGGCINIITIIIFVYYSKTMDWPRTVLVSYFTGRLWVTWEPSKCRKIRAVNRRPVAVSAEAQAVPITVRLPVWLLSGCFTFQHNWIWFLCCLARLLEVSILSKYHLICLFIFSFIRLFNYSFINLFIRFLIFLFIYLFIALVLFVQRINYLSLL